MPRIDATRLPELPRLLALAFYALLTVALLAALAGAVRLGFGLLIAGGCLHAVRVGLEEARTPARRVSRRG